MLAARLVAFATPLCEKLTVRDIRIGLGYTCVELSDGSVGLAWTPGDRAASCTHLKGAGGLIGLPAGNLLAWLTGPDHLARAIGLAVFNAINMNTERAFAEEEALDLLGITASDHVVMVGHFAPVIPKIKATGCHLDVVELDGGKPGIIGAIEGNQALERCDVAIITSTSIINDTIDGLLAKLTRNRSAVMLGPSTPLCRQAFLGTRISQLTGVRVLDAEAVKNTISQGGGTMLLKKHLRFLTEMVQ